MTLVLLTAISTTFILGAEFIKRKYSVSVDITRRLIHIGTATVAVIAPLYVTKEILVLVSLIFAGVLFVGRTYNLFSAVHSVKRYTFGEVYLPLGVAITALIFLPQNIQAFQYGVLIMGISDAVGGFIGEKFGKHTLKIFQNNKTLEGSISFFLCSVIITTIFYPVFGYWLVIIPLVLTFVEIIFVYGLDNLVLPIIAAYLFQFFIK
jgi:phytol kinase